MRGGLQGICAQEHTILEAIKIFLALACMDDACVYLDM